ncbi:MAG: HlyC/CorC family transporter [Candidatus Hydrogenedentes bacterium]|nr:HlyC/CorC family transporter [Candidatus Hydrogenedentota bacterium]
MITTVFVFFMALLLNAFFAGYETGFVACNPIRVRYLAEKEKNLNARALLRFMERPDHMLTLLLIGTNLALVTSTFAFTQLTNPSIAALLVTPIILIFAEVVPKSMFRIHPTRLALLFLPLVRAFAFLLWPLVTPITWLARPFRGLIGDETRVRNIRLLMSSVEDVRSLVDESADHGTLEPEKREMIHSVIDLQQQQANEVMVPRIDMKALPRTAARRELVQLFADTGLTRIPVYGNSIDEIVGVVSAFDVLTDATPENESIDRFVRSVMHVPDSMKLDDLLKAMRRAGQHIAIVTDEYGGTDGLIAIEDILEEVLGDIQDEFDKVGMSIRKVGPDAYVIDARMELEAAARAMELDVRDEEVETVAGWIMHAVGRIPAKGEVLEFDRYRVTVLEGAAHHISSIRLEVLPREGSNAAQKEVKDA